MNILWAAFMMSVVMYGLIGWMAIDHEFGSGSLWADPLAAKLWVAAAVGSVGSVGFAFWNVPQKAKTLDGRGEVDGPFVRFLFRAASGELPVVLGLALAFTTEDIRHLVYLGPISLVLLIANRPQLS